MTTASTTTPKTPADDPSPGQGAARGLAILRVTLGVLILATWWDNLVSDFYTAEGLDGFFGWLFTPADQGGNGSALDAYRSLLDATLLRATGTFGAVLTVVEFGIGLGLLVGGLARLASLAAIAFFANLFLAYFGGEEWIWTYVLLMAASLAVFLGHAGRTFGLDALLVKAKGRSTLGLLW